MTDSPDPTTLEDEGFLSRWSRRKLHREQSPVYQPAVDPPSAPQVPRDEAVVEPPQDQPAAQPTAQPTDADMPDPETLADDSDYSGFLSPRVSQELRRMALRRLFRSDRFKTPCNLNEYGGDYTQFVPLGDTITAEMRHRLAQEALKRTAAESSETAPAAAQAAPREENVVAATETDSAEPSATVPDDEPPPAGDPRQERL